MKKPEVFKSFLDRTLKKLESTADYLKSPLHSLFSNASKTFAETHSPGPKITATAHPHQPPTLPEPTARRAGPR